MKQKKRTKAKKERDNSTEAKERKKEINKTSREERKQQERDRERESAKGEGHKKTRENQRETLKTEQTCPVFRVKTGFWCSKNKKQPKKNKK